MTSKIKQNVVPRRNVLNTFSLYRGKQGGWIARQRRNKNFSSDGTRSGQYRGGLNKRSLYQRGSVSQATIAMTFALVVLISMTALGMFYLKQVLGTASTGTDIQRLETELLELSERQRELELDGAKLRSMQAVEDRVESLNLVNAEQFAYLVNTPDRVALSE